MKHTGIPLGPEMELEEHLQRASKSLPFNGYCLEIVLYSIRIGDRGFAYTLNEPLRLGKDFQSLRTATYVTLGASTTKKITIQHVRIVRQSRQFFQDALGFLRSINPTISKKKLIAVDSTFVYDKQVEFHLQVVEYPGPPEERPSRFLLAFKTMEVVLQLLA
jgi:hypothetical protein